jgi:hypothetical protein
MKPLLVALPHRNWLQLGGFDGWDNVGGPDVELE